MLAPHRQTEPLLFFERPAHLSTYIKYELCYMWSHGAAGRVREGGTTGSLFAYAEEEKWDILLLTVSHVKE